MALQVWLPLNGDLKNKGVADVNVTNSGATVDSNGKIGQCYSFDGTDDYFQFNNLDIDNLSGFSICFWCYSVDATLYGLFTVRQGTYHQFTLNEDGLGFRDSNHSSFTTFMFEQPNANTWTHYAIVYDNGSFKVYKNGINICTQTYSSGHLNSNLNEIRIGRRQASSGNVYFNGKLNDFRIYNHALSLAEVKEISRGLVLHYKLNDPYIEDTINLFAGRTDFSDTANWNKGSQSAPTPTIDSNGDMVLYGNGENTSTQSYTISRTGGYIAISPSTTYTISINAKHSSSTTRFSMYFYEYDSSTSLVKTTSDNYYCTENEVGQWVNHSLTVTTQSTTSKMYIELNCIRAPQNSTVVIQSGSIQLEQKDHATPFVDGTRSGTTITDSSGYKRNATITGTLIQNLNSPRYDKYVYMNNTSSSNHIESNPISCSDNIFSVSFWIKCTKATNQVLVADPKISIGLLNGLLYVNPTSSSPFTTTNFTTNEWNHIVVIRNGSSYSVYINGVAETQSGSSNYYAHNVSKLWLLNRSYNNNYAANASISDFRIYATALSAEDILQLYQVSGKIDNKKNLHCFELEEHNTSDNTKLFKTGVFRAGEFNEIDNNIKIKKDLDVDSNQLIEM